MNDHSHSGKPRGRLLVRAGIGLTALATVFGVIVGFGPIGPPHTNTTPAAIHVGATRSAAPDIR